jgi:2-aminoadipate transaminase
MTSTLVNIRMSTMKFRFADRLTHAPASFLDELFRVSSDPAIISFAGGLPSSELIDLGGIKVAMLEVMDSEGREALQYTTTDGYLPLREYIARRYRTRLGIPARAEEIQIVNGSQQCLDLFAKILINPGDHVGIERPGYLGAVEAFSLYEPVIDTVPLGDEGPDIAAFEDLITSKKVQFFYGIPNSQNPSGRTYTEERRREIAEIVSASDSLFYEDDAFGELFFDGRPRTPVKRYLPEQAVIGGSFSKIIAPGMRIGWILAPQEILSRFNIVKQAADLHSNYLCQKVMHRYLTTTDLDDHIRKIVKVYGTRCQLMCDLLDDLLPDLMHTVPEGGMFLLATLPGGISARRVFDEGIRSRVAIMPGMPFYTDGGGEDTIRLNFSSATEEQIKEGIGRLAHVISCLARG